MKGAVRDIYCLMTFGTMNNMLVGTLEVLEEGMAAYLSLVTIIIMDGGRCCEAQAMS